MKMHSKAAIVNNFFGKVKNVCRGWEFCFQEVFGYLKKGQKPKNNVKTWKWVKIIFEILLCGGHWQPKKKKISDQLRHKKIIIRPSQPQVEARNMLNT